jgi:CheY-like chemotaxis protein
MPNVRAPALCHKDRDLDETGVCGASTITAGSTLLVSPAEEDHDSLEQMFRQQGWILYKTRTLGSALAFLRANPVPVVIAERNLPPGDWVDLLNAIHRLPEPPLPIVTSQLADDYLWAEVLNLGGHDVLAKPFQLPELRWVLGGAWRIMQDNGHGRTSRRVGQPSLLRNELRRRAWGTQFDSSHKSGRRIKSVPRPWAQDARCGRTGSLHCFE